MQEFSRELIQFFRQQYPKGSRIKLTEMKDTQKLRDDDHAEESETAPQGGMELTQSVVDEKKEKKAGHKSAYKSPYNTGGVK